MSANIQAAAVARQRQALLQLVQLDKSELETALPRILEADARALEVQRVSFWRLPPDHASLQCECMFHLDGRVTVAPPIIASSAPHYFAALLQSRVIAADDVSADPRTAIFTTPPFAEWKIQSLLDVPVWHRGQLVGVVCHEHVGAPRKWLEAESDFAISVAGTIAVGLEADARRHAETRYALLTRAMEDLVWDWDFRTDRIEWSDAVFSALRYRPDQVTGDLQWWSRHVHPDDLSRVKASLDNHRKVGTGVWREEYRFRRGDGTWATISDRGVLERAPSGVALRMVGAMVDVTAQRLMQSRLAVADRMASVGTMAAGVAHEINNPLTYVSTNLLYAKRLLAAQLNGAPKIVAALDDAAQGVERVRAIVSDLKTFSRADEAEGAVVEVSTVIESALRIAQNEISHRARLRCEGDSSLSVLGNSAKLGQVLLNLLLNAAHAIPDGNADGNEITLRTGLAGPERMFIEVRDTGTGIPAELLARVFDPFFTTKPVGEGMGLGLSICHSIVTSMDGTLTLENNADRGVTARIELEVAPSPAQTVNDAAPHATTSGAKRGRVLVIDDLQNVGISLQRLFAEFHDVDHMTESAKALEAIRRGERWDVILCDLMMPVLNGMEFVAELQKVDPSLLSRVVIMTGGAFTPQARQFLVTWPYRRLDKPFDPEALMREVDQAVAENRTR